MVVFLLFFVSGQTCGQTTYNGNFISFYTTEIVNVYKGSRRFEKSQNTSRRLRPERSALPSWATPRYLIFWAPRALPVVTKPLSSLLCNLPIGKSLPLLFVRFFRHGGAHKRPQAEPHLVLHETSAQAMRNCIPYPYIITQLRRFVNIYFKSSAFLFKVSINPVPVYIV